MAHAPPPFSRTNTAPVFPTLTDGVARLQNSMTSAASAPRASQLSGSTAFASNGSVTSLSGATIAVAPANGQVVATSNIINQKADASRSLYQICVALRQRLSQVPGFDEYRQQLDELYLDEEEGGPVGALWRLLQTGYPLLTIYNALRPQKPLQVDETIGNEAKRSKIAIANFVRACLNDLKPPPEECFIINDLTGNDTTGLVKVISVINHVLDLAEQKNLLLQAQASHEDDSVQDKSQMSYRDYVVRELVDTERKYVQDLENLHDLKKTLEMRGVIPGDIIHNIFLNINAILDHQRRFLIRVETTNSMPPEKQDWGGPFVAYENAFDSYQPFIANQPKAARLALQVFDKIQSTEHPVTCDFNTLDGFLLKPMQRLVKYPLLLKDLLKKSEDENAKADLTAGIEAAERVLQKANEAVDRDQLEDAFQDLKIRVDDWKTHRIDEFGKLLLHGVHTVITGKTEQEKDYEIYLFENIMLCCKEASSPVKGKDKKDKTKSAGPKVRNKNAKLQLKGRIFMTNVTEVVAMSKTGSYTVQIWWKGDGVEYFTIKFQNEETMRKWSANLDQQRKENTPQVLGSEQPAPDFAWMQSQVNGLENPYTQNDDDDDDDDGEDVYRSTPTPSLYSTQVPQPMAAGAMPRNASSTSLRQRSATTDSSQPLASLGRAAPPPRVPLPQPPSGLSLQTHMAAPGQQSPNPQFHNSNSFFSPTTESPASSRTSTASSFFPTAGHPFPQTGAPPPMSWEDNNRYTAPAMPPGPPRDGPSPVNAYGIVTANGRNPRGPSLPAMASQSSAQLQQQRSRSYSTPDINGMSARRQNGQPVPAVPDIPAHLHPTHQAQPTHERHNSALSRSNTGSPRADLPMRTNAQSPSAQREREKHYGGGNPAMYPAQPMYTRQGSASSASGIPMAPLLSGDSIDNPLGSPGSEIPLPTQLKVKVNYDSGNYVTLVVAFNITYESLIDRIDAKLSRFTTSNIARGHLKLRYQDEDGDFVTIESDEDIQIAISEWREGMRNTAAGAGGVGEIELFCVGEMN